MRRTLNLTLNHIKARCPLSKVSFEFRTTRTRTRTPPARRPQRSGRRPRERPPVRQYQIPRSSFSTLKQRKRWKNVGEMVVHLDALPVDEQHASQPPRSHCIQRQRQTEPPAQRELHERRGHSRPDILARFRLLPLSQALVVGKGCRCNDNG